MTKTASVRNSYGRDQVVQIINSVIDKVQQHGDFAAKDVLHHELHELKRVIEDARRQIGAARPSEIKGVHIPTATDELDAVVEATAQATGTIMDACESIQKNFGRMDPSLSALIESDITKIFEACSFQDITGQRISKVVKTIQAIEEKVDKILHVLEDKMPGIEETAADSHEKPKPVSLVNGPQLPDKAITQSDIDRLLAEFDN